MFKPKLKGARAEAEVVAGSTGAEVEGAPAEAPNEKLVFFGCSGEVSPAGSPPRPRLEAGAGLSSSAEDRFALSPEAPNLKGVLAAAVELEKEKAGTGTEVVAVVAGAEVEGVELKEKPAADGAAALGALKEKVGAAEVVVALGILKEKVGTAEEELAGGSSGRSSSLQAS